MIIDHNYKNKYVYIYIKSLIKNGFHIRILFLIWTWAAFTVKVTSSTDDHTPGWWMNLEFMSERIGVRVIRCCCVCNKCSWKVFEMVQSCKRPLTPPLFFCKVFCECRGKNVHTEGSPNRVFSPVTPPRRPGHYTALCQVTRTSASHRLMLYLNPTDT